VAATGGDLKVGLAGGELEHVTAGQRLCRVKVRVKVRVEVEVKVRVWRCR
jgi:hypothetical protein